MSTGKWDWDVIGQQWRVAFWLMTALNLCGPLLVGTATFHMFRTDGGFTPDEIWPVLALLGLDVFLGAIGVMFLLQMADAYVKAEGNRK